MQPNRPFRTAQSYWHLGLHALAAQSSASLISLQRRTSHDINGICFFPPARILSAPMRRQFSLFLTLAAWLLATGSQWDLVQTFAWAQMFADNARVLPLGAALARTFSPEGRCGLCAAVTTAKQQEENSAPVPEGKAGGKIFLLYQPAPAPVVAAPAFAPWSLSDPLVASLGRAAPPSPPPRALA